MKITGKVTEICPSEKTPNGQHESMEIVVETVSGEYPESMAVKFWNKEIEKLSNLSEGMQVGFDLKAKVNKGNNGKNYNNLSGRNLYIVVKANIEYIQQGAISNKDPEDLPF